MEAPTSVYPDWLVLLLLAGMVIAVLTILYRATKGKWGSAAWLAIPLIIGYLFLIVGYLFVGSHREVEVIEGVARIGGNEVNEDKVFVASEPSTEEMWNKLTEFRIPLDDEAAGDTATETKKSPPPEWVEKSPSRVGDVYRVVVSSEPFSTVDECYAQLERRFPVVVQNRLAKLAPENQRELVKSHAPDEFGITLDYIMREICKQEYTETKDFSVGDMKKVHVLMEFSPDVESHLLAAWQSFLRQDRLVVVAKIAALVLVILSSVYGLLYVDTMTRGYYTNRLLVGASAAIIAIAVALFVS